VDDGVVVDPAADVIEVSQPRMRVPHRDVVEASHPLQLAVADERIAGQEKFGST